MPIANHIFAVWQGLSRTRGDNANCQTIFAVWQSVEIVPCQTPTQRVGFGSCWSCKELKQGGLTSGQETGQETGQEIAQKRTRETPPNVPGHFLDIFGHFWTLCGHFWDIFLDLFFLGHIWPKTSRTCRKMSKKSKVSKKPNSVEKCL